MAQRARRRPSSLNRPLGALIRENPKILRLLDKHGITFCPGCFLTLFSVPARAAAYHAVPDPESFLSELRRLTAKGPSQ